MIVFDATMMLLAIRPDVRPPIDENTGLPVEHVEVRINALIAQLEKEKVRILFPTPALSELLVRAGSDTQSIIHNIQKNAVFRIVPFDTLAAIEVAAMTHQALNEGDKRLGVDSTWAKVKYDRQIIAIAKVHRATIIYSDDNDIRALSGPAKINVLRLVDIPVPQKDKQYALDFKKQKENIVEVSSELGQEDCDEEHKTKEIAKD